MEHIRHIVKLTDLTHCVKLKKLEIRSRYRRNFLVLYDVINNKFSLSTVRYAEKQRKNVCVTVDPAAAALIAVCICFFLVIPEVFINVFLELRRLSAIFRAVLGEELKYLRISFV